VSVVSAVKVFLCPVEVSGKDIIDDNFLTGTYRGSASTGSPFGKEAAVVFFGLWCFPFAHRKAGSVAIDDGVGFVFAESGWSIFEFWHDFFPFFTPNVGVLVVLEFRKSRSKKG
jgi:hypothetical protein